MHQHYQHLIIGGGIAGVTAAETIRAHDRDAHIAIIETEPHMLYSRVLLPSFLKGRIPRGKLFLRTEADFTEKKIDIQHEETVASIDTAHKEVSFAHGKGMTYEKLLLATGGRVKEWGRPEDQHLIYRLQTLDDADRLFAALPSIKNPLVVGSSFISLELLEIFLSNHIAPTLLVRDPHFFGNLLEEGGSRLMHENFMRLGIKVDYNDTVARIDAVPAGTEVMTKKLEKYMVDAVAVGIGVDRNLDYVRNSGVILGGQGIRTNEFLETAVPDIFAAGDVAEYYDTITGSHRAVGNWTGAVLQGARAGLNMLGKREAFVSVPSYSITNMGLQITALGDMSDPEHTAMRIDMPRKQYARFFFRDNMLAGAVLINRFRDKAHLADLIFHRTDVTRWRDQFVDDTFDIHSIPVVI